MISGYEQDYNRADESCQGILAPTYPEFINPTAAQKGQPLHTQDRWQLRTPRSCSLPNICRCFQPWEQITQRIIQLLNYSHPQTSYSSSRKTLKNARHCQSQGARQPFSQQQQATWAKEAQKLGLMPTSKSPEHKKSVCLIGPDVNEIPASSSLCNTEACPSANSD